MCTSFFTISNGNYCGIVDENQKEILPCIFTFVSIFTGASLFFVRKTNSLKFGLYNFEDYSRDDLEDMDRDAMGGDVSNEWNID